ncbi:MAG TPA: response regulator [Bryobacteraceae bacterium]|nr:response regulator [Bryobacteraceae bacterium]
MADSDVLRRDGLKAVLQSNGEIEVVAGCADGQTTIDTIRDLRPEVAIIDLNLPGLHGIELVRRVRGEALGTKIVIVAGTADDEIVREVVRAGADGYLLKNGPARHLIDAINYVRDGGQYFSPQLGRDGRDRHLLEEPPRVPAEIARRDTELYDERRGRPSSDYRGPEQRLRPRTTDPERLRERIREETHRDLRDRDYEIMSKMARTEGIGALLDRLDELEGRVMEMEAGEEPLPADPREWLSRELADTLGDSRYSDSRGGRGGRSQISAREMEARLPQMIEEAVTRRFQSMAGKLQEEIEEQHVRTLETFVKNIQTKLVQRVSVLEQNMSQQAEAMQQLREYNQRTEDNLSRLLSGVDKLATELPKRLAAAQAEAAAEPAENAREEAPKETKREREKEKKAARGPVKNLGPKIFWAVMGLAIVGGVVYEVHFKPAEDDAVVVTSPDGAPAKAAKVAPPSASADTKTKMEAAKQYADRKEYQTAEDIYKQVVQTEPSNEEAIKALASVQYREGKIEDSAATLDRLQKR